MENKASAAETTHLVRDAVEDLHGQVRHLGEGVRGQVKQDPPDLSVNAVKRHAWRERKKRERKNVAMSTGELSPTAEFVWPPAIPVH